MSNIPSIINDAELSLEKLDGMIDAADHSKLKAAVEELGASYRKRAYGYSLNELYTVTEMLKSKKISAEDLTNGLKNIENAALSINDAAKTMEAAAVQIYEQKHADMMNSLQYLLDLVMTVRDPEEYNKTRDKLRDDISLWPIYVAEEAYIIMSPGGGISLDISSNKGTCYVDLDEAKKDLEATNKWSKPRGRGVYELVTLRVRKKY